MRKLFRFFTILLVLSLIIGCVPVSAGNNLSMAKEKVLYLDGSKGKKEDGTSCKTSYKKIVANMIKGFDRDTMEVVLNTEDKNIVSTTKTGRIVAKSLGTTTVNVKVFDADETQIFDQDLKVLVKKNATEVTVKGINNGDHYIAGQSVMVSLPRVDDTDRRELKVDNPEYVEIVEGDKARTWMVTFVEPGEYTFTARAFQSEKYPASTAEKTIKVTVDPVEGEETTYGTDLPDVIEIDDLVFDEEDDGEEDTVEENRKKEVYVYLDAYLNGDQLVITPNFRLEEGYVSPTGTLDCSYGFDGEESTSQYLALGVSVDKPFVRTVDDQYIGKFMTIRYKYSGDDNYEEYPFDEYFDCDYFEFGLLPPVIKSVSKVTRIDNTYSVSLDLIGNCLADQGEIGYYYLLTPSHLESYDDLSPEELVNTVKNLYNNREANGEENNTYFGYGVIDGTEDYNIEQTVDIQIDGSDFEEGYYVLRIVVAGTPSDDFGDVFNYSKMAVSPVFNTPLTPTVAIYTNVNVDEDTIQISGNIVDIVDDSVLTGTLKFEYSIDGTNWVSIPESIGLGAENAYAWDIPDAVKGKLFSIKATYSGDNTYNSAESEIYTVDLEAPAVTDLDVIKNDGKYEFLLMISNTEISVLNCYALLTEYSESGYDATTIDDIVDDNNLIEVSSVGNDDNVYTATIDESVFAPGVYVYQVVVADINGNMGEKLVTAPFVTTLSLTEDDLTASAGELSYSGKEQIPVVTLAVNNESETVKALIEDKVSAAVEAGDISYSFVRVKDAAGNEIEPEEAVTAVKEAGVYDIYAISDDADIQIDNVKIGKVTVNGGEKSAEPTLTEECSFSTDTMLVEISGIVNSTIYYNVDGTEYSKTCTGSAITFYISKTTTVTAYAVENGKLKSEEVERTYTKVDAQTPSTEDDNNTDDPEQGGSQGGDQGSGDTGTPSVNTETPSNNTETPSVNTETPSSNTETPSGNTGTPSDNNGTPAGDTGSSGDKDESGDNKTEVKELVITVPATIKYDPTITQPSGYFTGENPIANLVVTADGTELTSDEYFVLYTKNGSIIIKELNAGDKIDVKVSLLADDKVSSTASFMLVNNGSIDPLCPVVGIDESTKEIVLVKGQKFTLPEGTWKSEDKGVVYIKKQNLTAKKAGNTKISNGSLTIDVTVVEPKMSPKSITMVAGEEKKAPLVIKNITFNTRWDSNKPEVATVSDEGIIHAYGKGTAKVTAYINGKGYSVNVKVLDANTGKKDFTETVYLRVGQQAAIKISGLKVKGAECVVDEGNSRDEINGKNIMLQVEDDNNNLIAEVSNAGKIKAINAGEVKFTLKNDGKEQQIHVIVYDVPYVMYLIVGKSQKLKLYGASGSVECSDDYDKSIISIDSKNKIKGVKPGETTIKVKSGERVDEVRVVVEDYKITNLKGSETKYELTLKAGDTQKIEFAGLNRDIVINSNKPEIAYVDSDRVIHALKNGKAKLTAKINGKKVTINLVVNNVEQ